MNRSVPAQPWVDKPGDRSALEAAAQRFRGQTLARVKYLSAAGECAVSPHRRGVVEEIDFGVEFVTSEGIVFRAAWQMHDVEQGLLFGPAPTERPWPSPVTASDVSGSEHWRALIDKRVREVVLAWHVAEEGASESVWAVRIQLDEGLSIVVALGTVLNGPPIAYMPNAVVVIFDETMARCYTIPTSSTSALGT